MRQLLVAALPSKAQLVIAALLVAACGAAPIATKPTPRLVVEPPVAKVPGSYWEDVQVDAVTLAPASFERDKLVHAGLKERFDELPEALRARALEHGIVAIARSDHEASFGEAYLALAKKHVPFVITLDVLFALAFRALDRAEGEVDRDVIAVVLPAALTETSDRLTAESRAARSDTAEAYALARGVVAVARVLAAPTTEIPHELEDVVSAEVSRIGAHAGPGKSPLLGRTLDYGAFDTQAGLTFGDPRIGPFRAVTWLARAALALSPEPPLVSVARARTHTRAAMLLSRATNDSWRRVAEAFGFVVGRGDDPGTKELVSKASALGLDLRDEATIANVVRVDHLRGELARDATPTLEDTSGTAPTFRLLSPSAPADARALYALVASPAATHMTLPTALGVALALGSPEARTLLDASFDEKPLDDATHILSRDQAERHASLHASGLDALATYLGPSTLDSQRPWRDTPAYRRRKLEVALAGWVTLRHATIPFAHGAARVVIDEPVSSYEDMPAAVEPHAEALARLVAFIRQARRGLGTLALMRDGGASSQLLDHVESLIDDALHVALAQAIAPLPPNLAHTLASMPARIANIERRLGPSASPLVVVTAANMAKGQVLEDATGTMSDVWLAIDVGGAASFFVGARIPFFETASTLRETDASWAKRLIESPPAPPTWAPSVSP